MNLNLRILSYAFLLIMYGTSFGMIKQYNKTVPFLHKKNTFIPYNNQSLPLDDDFDPVDKQLQSCFHSLPKEMMITIALAGDRTVTNRLRETCRLYKQSLTIEDNPVIVALLSQRERKYRLLNALWNNNDKVINIIKPFAEDDERYCFSNDHYILIDDNFLIMSFKGYFHSFIPKSFDLEKLKSIKSYLESQNDATQYMSRRDYTMIHYDNLYGALMVNSLCGNIEIVKSVIEKIKEANSKTHENQSLTTAIKKIIEENKFDNNQILLSELIKQDYEQIFKIIVKEDPYNIGDDEKYHASFIDKLDSSNMSEYKKVKYLDLYIKHTIKDALL